MCIIKVSTRFNLGSVTWWMYGLTIFRLVVVRYRYRPEEEISLADFSILHKREKTERETMAVGGSHSKGIDPNRKDRELETLEKSYAYLLQSIKDRLKENPVDWDWMEERVKLGRKTAKELYTLRYVLHGGKGDICAHCGKEK